MQNTNTRKPFSKNSKNTNVNNKFSGKYLYLFESIIGPDPNKKADISILAKCLVNAFKY